MNIGVFDSGIGGKAIAQSLARDFPEARIQYIHDIDHMPYGGRTKDEIITLTEAAIQPLLKSACDCIVLACNTATAAAIDYLREKYPTQKFIGLEPMVKPAIAASKTGVIAVCATPYTLKSERYLALKEQFAANVTILEPDCSEWAEMIEHNAVDDEKITEVVEAALRQNTDVIVLACTHYHWIKEEILEKVGDRASILDPSDAISKRVAELLNPTFVA